MINLNGHSGCNVILYGDNIVRKTSPTLEYNTRLKTQMEKQQSFSHHTLKSPQIYDWGYNEHGMFYFDMEYIHGVSLSVYFQRERLHKCMEIIDLVTSFQTYIKQVDIKQQVIDKIHNIDLDKDTKELLILNDWLINTGYGHGDLTFENIIIRKNEVYLIDFLDSFVDGSLIDESKLLQDAFCYWSFKDQTLTPKRKLLSVSEKFNSKQHYCMLLLHLVRIIPYSNSNKKEKLLCMIENVKSQINQF
jgi:tRNA A-37 threonylcarbamoyl transferase component Bud32